MSEQDKRRAYDERLRAALAADPHHQQHGSATGYRAGCRCARCTAAHAQRLREHRVQAST